MQYPRFSILPIIRLSDLFPMFPRASRTIKDNSLRLSSVSPLHSMQADFASSCNLNLALYTEISLKIKFLRSGFVVYDKCRNQIAISFNEF